MGVKFTQLQCKEVICLSDGRRLGFVSDVVVDVCEGTVRALVVPGECQKLGIRRDDYIIPWDCIRRVGPDIVLVEVKCDECRVPRQRQRHL